MIVIGKLHKFDKKVTIQNTLVLLSKTLFSTMNTHVFYCKADVKTNNSLTVYP